MAQKDWEKTGNITKTKMITYQNKDTLNQLDILNGKGNYWYVQVEQNEGVDIAVIILGKFKSKEQALKKAMSYMENH